MNDELKNQTSDLDEFTNINQVDCKISTQSSEEDVDKLSINVDLSTNVSENVENIQDGENKCSEKDEKTLMPECSSKISNDELRHSSSSHSAAAGNKSSDDICDEQIAMTASTKVSDIRGAIERRISQSSARSIVPYPFPSPTISFTKVEKPTGPSNANSKYNLSPKIAETTNRLFNTYTKSLRPMGSPRRKIEEKKQKKK